MITIIRNGYMYVNRASHDGWNIGEADFITVTRGNVNYLSLCGITTSYLMDKDKLPEISGATLMATYTKGIEKVFLHMNPSPSVIVLDDRTELVHAPAYVKPKALKAMGDFDFTPYGFYLKLKEITYVPDQMWEVFKVSEVVTNIKTLSPLKEIKHHLIPGYIKKRIKVKQ